MSSFCSKKILPVVLFVAFVAVAGCKKDREIGDYSFAYSGSQYVGGQLYFTTTAPANNSLLWDFGDSVSSSVSVPGHSYTHAGVFTVSLVVNGDAANIRRKTVSIGVDSLHQALANRNWMCQVKCEGYDPIKSKHVTLNYNDTSMPANSTGPGMLSFNGDSLSYSSSTDSTIVFSQVHYNNPAIPYSAYAWSGLVYNYVANKIVYTYRYHVSAASGNWIYTCSSFR